MKRTAILTLVSPLAHGAEQSRIRPETLPQGVDSNYTPHRRLPIILKKGEQQYIAQLPAVSGNSIRHTLREIIVDPTLYTLGKTRRNLDKNILDTFIGGGGMDKKDKDKNEKEEMKSKENTGRKLPILVRDRDTLRALVPMLSLFGCSYGNRMLSGLVNVGWAIPAVTETSHITGFETNLSYSHDMLSFQLNTRHDPKSDDEAIPTKQSIFYQEVVTPGVPFYHWIDVELTTPLERSALQLALELFKKKPYLGGKGSVGQGLVDTSCWYDDLDVPSSLYLNWLDKNKETIVQYIDLWNQPEKLVKLDDKQKECIEYPKKLSEKLDDLVKEREEAIHSEFAKQMRGE